MVKASSPHQTTPSTNAESKLLLMSARPFFDAKQLSMVSSLAERVTNWDFVANTAIRKFSAPYLHRALVKSACAKVPPQVLEQLSNFENDTRLRVLKIAATQLEFHKACIEPLGIEHAYLKGVALSLQFGGNYADRYCRDIDVLVDERDFKSVIMIAVNAGYRIMMSPDPLKLATTPNDLKFVTRYPVEVGLLSRDGVLIELHRRLDKKHSIFNSKHALENAEPVELSGMKMQTLDRNLHFTYVCYHHSRHFWSHLHWLADLDLMLRGPDMNLVELNKLASQLGLEPTTKAAIEFNKLTSMPDEWPVDGIKNNLAGHFLNACILNLNGGLDLEKSMRSGASFRHDFIDRSQVSHSSSGRLAISYWRNRLNPLLSQYAKRPIPASFFWFYRFELAFILCSNWVKNFFNKSKRFMNPK